MVTSSTATPALQSLASIKTDIHECQPQLSSGPNQAVKNAVQMSQMKTKETTLVIKVKLHSRVWFDLELSQQEAVKDGKLVLRRLVHTTVAYSTFCWKVEDKKRSSRC